MPKDRKPHIFRGDDGAFWVRGADEGELRVGKDFEEAKRVLGALAERSRDEVRHALYLIEGMPGFVKVGIAANVKLRLGGLQTSCPHDLRVASVVWFPGKLAAHRAEQEFLKKFKYVRARGEWIRDLPEVREAFEAVGLRIKFREKNPP